MFKMLIMTNYFFVLEFFCERMLILSKFCNAYFISYLLLSYILKIIY